MTTSVLFVCLGNFCRSPMAEATFRQLVADAGLSDQVEIDSAGTGNWHIGSPPHPETQAVLHAHGIPTDGMQARKMQPYDLARFDYVVVMDDENARDVERLARRHGGQGEIVRLLDFADPAITDGVRNVPDPYYVGGFDYVYDLVRSGSEGLLARITTDELSG